MAGGSDSALAGLHSQEIGEMQLSSREINDVPVYIIGIDCATQPGKVGLALARWDNGKTVVSEACNGGKLDDDLERILQRWLKPGSGPYLLALDAPLGWPNAMRDRLADHIAGRPFKSDGVGIEQEKRDRDTMFRRFTDLEIADVHGKTPLDVGADRIARTAYWTLTLIGKLGKIVGKEIPLAWSTDLPEDCSAIEVYPAVTMLSHKLQVQGYKQSGGEKIRAKCLGGLERKLKGRVTVDDRCTDIAKQADVFDAVMCIVAAADFLDGLAVGPPDEERDRVRREGWIWVAAKSDQVSDGQRNVL